MSFCLALELFEPAGQALDELAARCILLIVIVLVGRELSEYPKLIWKRVVGPLASDCAEENLQRVRLSLV